MTGSPLRLLSGLAVAVTLVTTVHAQQTPPPAKNPLLKLVEPWPEPAQMQKRKADAEALRLFASEDPLRIKLVADFKTINKDRNPNSKKQYAAELSVEENGASKTMAIKLNARGHLRRMARTCEFVPLRLELPSEQAKGTIFQGQDAMKLVVQCREHDNFEQYLLREYLAYRVFNTLTPSSFRARLVKVSYVDFGGKEHGERYAMLLEDNSDVAKRMEGRIVDIQRATFKDVHQDTLDTMMLFEYMIANTDFSIYALHNVVIMQKPDRVLYTVPYDLDISGLVSPPYGIPDPRLPIKVLTERLYRGPCRTPEQGEAAMARFKAVKDRILALPDTIADLDQGSRERTKKFLNEFYEKLDEPRDVRRLFSNECLTVPGM